MSTTTNTQRPTSAAAQKRADRTEASDQLRKLLPTGSKVFVIVRSVAKSNTSRVLSFLVIQDGDLLDITRRVSIVTDNPMTSDHEGMRIRGGGMDMTFAAVYELSGALHGDGYALTREII